MSNIKYEENENIKNNKHDYLITTHSLQINSSYDSNNAFVQSINNNIENNINIFESLKNLELFKLPLSGIKLNTESNFEKSIESFIIFVSSILSPDKNKKEFLSEIINNNYKNIILNQEKKIKDLEKELNSIKIENEQLKEKLNYDYKNKSNLNEINNSEKIEINEIKKKQNEKMKLKESSKKSVGNKKKMFTEEEKRMINEKEEINTINYMLNYSKDEN